MWFVWESRKMKVSRQMINTHFSLSTSSPSSYHLHLTAAISIHVLYFGQPSGLVWPSIALQLSQKSAPIWIPNQKMHPLCQLSMIGRISPKPIWSSTPNLPTKWVQICRVPSWWYIINWLSVYYLCIEAWLGSELRCFTLNDWMVPDTNPSKRTMGRRKWILNW